MQKNNKSHDVFLRYFYLHRIQPPGNRYFVQAFLLFILTPLAGAVSLTRVRFFTLRRFRWQFFFSLFLSIFQQLVVEPPFARWARYSTFYVVFLGTLIDVVSTPFTGQTLFSSEQKKKKSTNCVPRKYSSIVFFIFFVFRLIEITWWNKKIERAKEKQMRDTTIKIDTIRYIFGLRFALDCFACFYRFNLLPHEIDVRILIDDMRLNGNSLVFDQLNIIYLLKADNIFILYYLFFVVTLIRTVHSMTHTQILALTRNSLDLSISVVVVQYSLCFIYLKYLFPLTLFCLMFTWINTMNRHLIRNTNFRHAKRQLNEQRT